MVLLIENTTKSIFDLDYEIKKFRNEYNEITPEFAKNILCKTNHRANIRFIIKLISSLDAEERKNFGEFVVCAVDGRRHDDSTYKELRNLAIECGCVEEFDSTNEKRKLYGPDDCMGTIARSTRDIQGCIDKGCITVIDFEQEVSDLLFKNADLSKVKLSRLYVRPDYISTFYESCTNYDKFDQGILTQGNNFFNDCDLGGGESFYISARNVRLDKITNMAKKCYLNNSSLGYSCVNCMCIISNSDFAGCERVWVSGFDDFTFSKVSNVSGNVLFSNIGEANIRGCDFENVESMTFDRVEKVRFTGGKLPRKLDVSKVKEVVFGEDIAFNVEEIVFKDIVQKNRALKGRKFSGKIKYTSLGGLGIGAKEK